MDSKVTFKNKNTDFYLILKKRVDQYFNENNISKNGNCAMYYKTFVMLSLYILPYLLIMTNKFMPFQMLFLGVLMAFGAAGIGMSVMHDGNHGAYSKNPLINKLAGCTFYLLGFNVLSWKITHNIQHHTYTNIYNDNYRLDEDLEEPRFLRLSPHAELKPWHRYQHLYSIFLFSFQTFKWFVYRDFNLFFKRDYKILKNSGRKNIIAKETFLLFISKILFAFFIIILPMLVLNITWWQLGLGLFAFNAISGIITYTIFQLAHVVEKADFPEPENGSIDSEWAIHQVATTVNFARKNKFLSWYVGGLNFQVEHHLFPHICHIHYPAISEIVKSTAGEFNLTYKEYPTFSAALRSHFNLLKKLGNEKFPVLKESGKVPEAELLTV
jgi:linoleoyl-CoA desaturase